MSDILQELQQLKAEYARLRTMVEHSYDLVYLMDENGTILFANPSTLRYGFAPEEVIGTNAFGWVHPDDLATLQAEFYTALERGQASVGVYRIRTANGEWRWVESVGANHLENPVVRAIVVNTRDVTDRVRTEQVMRESEKRFRSMVQNGSDMIGLLNRDGSYLYVSDSVIHILGHEPEAMNGRSAFEFIHPDDIPRLQARFAAVLEGSKATIEAFRFRTRDGAWRWIETVITNLLDDPHVRAIVANSRDVTEAKQVVEALQQSENRFRTIVETSREGIWMLDENGNTVYVNGRMAEMLGCTVDDMMGRPLFDFMDEVARAEAQRNFERRRQGVFEQHDFRFRHKDGHDVWTIIATSPLPLQNGEFAGTLGMVTDITERKHAEMALRESHQFMQSVWESMTDAFAFIDRNWRFVHVNGQAAAILQHSVEDLLGKTVHEVLPEASETPFFRAYEKAMTQNVQVTVEDFYAPLQKWYEARAYPAESGLSIYFSDVTERRTAHDRLLHSAFHDAVTGLPNRALFVDRLERSLRRMERHAEYSFAVLFLDLDRFKVVNDSLGHFNGDQLLIQVARRLQECVRPEDTVARLGGDEFTILMEGIKDVSDVTHLAERVQTELGRPFFLQGHEVFTSTSIGIALSGAGYENGDDLLRDADIAMYRAKNSGRSRYEIFDAAMHGRMMTLLHMENDLRRAIERQEFHLCYQPIIALKTGTVIGFEALTRWEHPERGLVSPLEFIPVAEESGLIVPLGKWVIGEACGRMNAWHDRFHDAFSEGPPLTICVNVSARQFAQPDFVQQVQQTLEETVFDPIHLKLEITESLLMENMESALPKLLQIKEMGLQLSMDDFGTGYSSLSHLSQFPIDVLKIDRSFVSRMSLEADKHAIIGTIINLAHNLNMTVIAEGVETREQMEQLRALNCDFVQGFFFARPMSADMTEDLLAQQPRW